MLNSNRLNADEIEEQARKILGLMNNYQKANQMAGDIPIISGLLEMLKRYNATPIPAGEDKELGISAIKFTDGPRGVVIGNSTCFPISMGRGASWDIELEERIGKVIGIEARAHGANFFAGVCINLLRHPAWGRAQETYGEDPYHLGEMGSALIRGAQNHVMACAKHYAANSIENSRFKVSVEIDERTLREIYLPHFKKCVDNGVASIMSAYNKVNGIYCGHNKHLLRDILKKDWNFDGFVISDFTFGIRDGVKAILGGMDIEMPHKFKMTPKKILKALDQGMIKQEHIDEAVLRILRQKLKFNEISLNNKEMGGEIKREEDNNLIYTKDKIACPEHVNLSLEAAEKSIVLLKNKNSILPLKKEKIKNILVVGELADTINLGDKGSSRVYPPFTITPLKGIETICGNDFNINYFPCKKANATELNKLGEMAKDSDVVIFIGGYTYKDEGEYIFYHGGDRKSLRLKKKDIKIINKISSINQNLIVCIESGSAVITEPWDDSVSAILMLWYPGMMGGEALANILMGKINPSGKLPFVVPKHEKYLPYFKSNTKKIKYDYYHGYRLFDKRNLTDKIAYPFGFGLSYSKFEYSELSVNFNKEMGKINIKFKIRNLGDYNGYEIAQVYVKYPEDSIIDRPIKELKAFKRIYIEKSSEKEIKLDIKLDDLRYYDITSNEWKLSGGKHEILVGPNSLEENCLHNDNVKI